MGLFSSSDPDPSLERYVAENAGDTVKLAYIENLVDFLDEDEQVHHVIRGPSAGVGNTASDAETKSTGTKGMVTTGFTGRRVVIRVPHFMTDDRYVINYSNAEGIEMNTEGLLGSRSVTIHTGGKSYWIGVMGTMDGEDIHETVDFANERIADSSSQETETKGPKQRLEELESMYEEGLVSESEYEEKRTEILDSL